jgi:hypothetical protein
MQWYDRDKFKLTGRDEPQKENRIIVWLLIAMLGGGLLYVLSFYI